MLLRPIDGLEARPIAGTEGAENGILSPDGRWIGFTIDARLSKVPFDGGLPILLTTTVGDWPKWGAGGAIVFVREGALAWISDAGEGPLHPLTRLSKSGGETAHSRPLFTPDGKAVVFTVQRQRSGGGPALGELAIAPLVADATVPAPHILLGVRGRYPIGIVDDWLLYVAEDRSMVMAVRLDLRRRRVVGAPVTVLKDTKGEIGTTVALGANGTMIYYHAWGNQSRPLLVDSSGAKREIHGVERAFAYRYPRVSPDGRRLAIQSMSREGTDLWIYDFAAGPPTRLTMSGTAAFPVWTPDGRHIVFVAIGGGGAQEFRWQPTDGSAPAETLFGTDGYLVPSSVTPDGRTLVYQSRVDNVSSIWSAALVGDHTPRPLVRERFDNFMPVVSPDGKWLAYVSTFSGRNEIYIRPFPEGGAAVQISTTGGTEPTWSRDGGRLYYRVKGALFATTLSRTPTLSVTGGASTFADDFESGYQQRNYDVTPDGKRFVMVGDTIPVKGPDLIVVMNWFTELRARLRAAR